MMEPQARMKATAAALAAGVGRVFHLVKTGSSFPAVASKSSGSGHQGSQAGCKLDKGFGELPFSF